MSVIINKLQLIFNRIKKLFLYITKGDWITKIEIAVKNYIKGKIPGTVRISIRIFILAMIFIILLTILTKGYKRSFGQGILIESFGMLFDLFVIAIIVLWLNERRDKKLKRELAIERYNEEIDDYRKWPSEEATYRIVGLIRRLNKLDFTEIDLSYCYLKNANLENVQLQGARIYNANLQSADISNANLQNVCFDKANLKKANFDRANLQGAYLFANIKGASFKWADLRNISIHPSFFSIVYSLFGSQLDDDIRDVINHEYPDLLKKPEVELPDSLKYSNYPQRKNED